MIDQEKFLNDTYNAIENASDKEEVIETIPCHFCDSRIIKRTITSQEVGYSIIEDFIWEPAYNNAGILGGNVIADIIRTLIEL